MEDATRFVPVAGMVVWASIGGAPVWPCLVQREVRASSETWRCRLLGEHPVHLPGAAFDVSAGDMEDFDFVQLAHPEESRKYATDAVQCAVEYVRTLGIPTQKQGLKAVVQLLPTSLCAQNENNNAQGTSNEKSAPAPPGMTNPAQVVLPASSQPAPVSLPPSSSLPNESIGIPIPPPPPSAGPSNLGPILRAVDEGIHVATDEIPPAPSSNPSLSVSAAAAENSLLPASSVIAAEASLPSFFQDYDSMERMKSGLEAKVRIAKHNLEALELSAALLTKELEQKKAYRAQLESGALDGNNQRASPTPVQHIGVSNNVQNGHTISINTAPSSTATEMIGECLTIPQGALIDHWNAGAPGLPSSSTLPPAVPALEDTEIEAMEMEIAKDKMSRSWSPSGIAGTPSVAVHADYDNLHVPKEFLTACRSELMAVRKRRDPKRKRRRLETSSNDDSGKISKQARKSDLPLQKMGLTPNISLPEPSGDGKVLGGYESMVDVPNANQVPNNSTSTWTDVEHGNSNGANLQHPREGELNTGKPVVIYGKSLPKEKHIPPPSVEEVSKGTVVIVNGKVVSRPE